MTVLHANHLIPATAALQREKNSCPLLYLHPSDITRAAAGKDLVVQRMTPGKSVVNWGEEPDHVHSPGRDAANYEKFRAHAWDHLVFNAFWKVQHFGVHQMLMRDPMHQIDLGAIVHLIRAILRKFKETRSALLQKSETNNASNLCSLNATALIIEGISLNMCHAQHAIYYTIL